MPISQPPHNMDGHLLAIKEAWLDNINKIIFEMLKNFWDKVIKGHYTNRGCLEHTYEWYETIIYPYPNMVLGYYVN